MSKIVIDIDIPDNCFDCFVGRYSKEHEFELECPFIDHLVTNCTYRPKDCPLKEAEEERAEINGIKQIVYVKTGGVK